MNSIKGQVIDILNRTIYPAEVVINKQSIEAINPTLSAPMKYILPGFIDAHIHIESSMLVPYEFAKIALRHGTVATISDPHEIANVLGVEGVDYMIENAKDAHLKFHFGAPSCVPATSFETAGAEIDSEAVHKLLQRKDIYYLSEMMNYPGVLNRDAEVINKLQLAKLHQKPIDGHAPGLVGDLAQSYISQGITTDHECFTHSEALDKLCRGMKILIREGSAAKNYQALHPLISSHVDQVMFCSDDKHPDDLQEGHINLLVKRALQDGHDLFNILKVACINPYFHYKMRSGLLRVGDPADFIVIDDLRNFKVKETYISGRCVMSSDNSTLTQKKHKIVNQFNAQKVEAEDFIISQKDYNGLPIIEAIDGELITNKLKISLDSDANGNMQVDLKQDILKIVVVNRYQNAPPAVAFIKNFGLKYGAIGSTVAHDSHNIVVVGTNDVDIAAAVNVLIDSKGGLCALNNGEVEILPLPIAGLMSDQDGQSVSDKYKELNNKVKLMGSPLNSPFMTLSFMALLVIPKIKLSDKGLFDADSFKFYR